MSKNQQKAPEQNLWNFNYKRGPAPMSGVVAASSEAMAYRVAERWCVHSGVKYLGTVRPMICADESILALPLPSAEPEPLVGAVAATTGVSVA